MPIGTFWEGSACLFSGVLYLAAVLSPSNQVLLHESFDLLFMSGTGQSLIFCSFRVRSQTSFQQWPLEPEPSPCGSQCQIHLLPAVPSISPSHVSIQKEAALLSTPRNKLLPQKTTPMNVKEMAWVSLALSALLVSVFVKLAWWVLDIGVFILLHNCSTSISIFQSCIHSTAMKTPC